VILSHLNSISKGMDVIKEMDGLIEETINITLLVWVACKLGERLKTHEIEQKTLLL